MGGKGSGTTVKPRVLPKRFRQGVIKRLDNRSAASRELRDDTDAIVMAHRGGYDNLTPLESLLIEQLVFANAWRRRIEEQAIRTRQLDVSKYVALVDRVHGIAKTIGLKRALKDAPSLAELIAQDKK